MDKKYFSGLIKGFDKNGIMTAYASTVTIDRDSEIVLPDSYIGSKDMFMKNPVLLQFHDYWKEPVGKVISLTHDDYGIIMQVEFAPTETGQKFKTLYEGGYMSAFSIGFMPKEWLVATDDRFDEVVQSRGVNSGVRRVYTDIELFEVSCVPVPANRDAVMMAAKSFLASDAGEFDDILRDLKELKESIDGGSDMADTKEKDLKPEDEVLEEEKELKSEDGEGEDVVEEDVETEEAEESEEKEADDGALVKELATLISTQVKEAIDSLEANIQEKLDIAVASLSDKLSDEVKALTLVVDEQAKEQEKKDELEKELGDVLASLKSLKDK